MSRYTFLRVEVDSDIVERVLGLTPGVEVVETLDGGRNDAPSPMGESGDEQSGDEQYGSEPAEGDGSSALGAVPPDGEMLEEGSALREYGLLGVGASFVMLGIATVGIWWYRRRTSGGSVDAETPPPATAFESPDEPATPAPSTGPSTDDPSEQASERPDSLSLDLDEDADEAEDDAADSTATEPASRREKREDVEWAPKWSDSPPEPSIDADDDEPAAEDPDASRPGESIDAAPLLGIAFVAVTGAIVRWAQGDDGA